jgi:hypothetical protein
MSNWQPYLAPTLALLSILAAMFAGVRWSIRAFKESISQLKETAVSQAQANERALRESNLIASLVDWQKDVEEWREDVVNEELVANRDDHERGVSTFRWLQKHLRDQQARGNAMALAIDHLTSRSEGLTECLALLASHTRNVDVQAQVRSLTPVHGERVRVQDPDSLSDADEHLGGTALHPMDLSCKVTRAAAEIDAKNPLVVEALRRNDDVRGQAKRGTVSRQGVTATTTRDAPIARTEPGFTEPPPRRR